MSRGVIVLRDFMNITIYSKRKQWIEEENEIAVKVNTQYWAIPQLEESQTESPGREPMRHPCGEARPSSRAGELAWAQRRGRRASSSEEVRI